MKKTYILDTNVLLSDPRCLRNFQDNDLIIPILVLEELDRHKGRSDEVGRNCREISRELDCLGETASLRDGVPLPNGGTLRVLSSPVGYTELLPPELVKGSSVDNMIIGFVLRLMRTNNNVILVSKDINVRVKCYALGIPAQDYLSIRVSDSIDDLYTGVKVVHVPEFFIDSFYMGQPCRVSDATSDVTYPNQILVLKSVDSEGNTLKSALSRVMSDGHLRMFQKFESIFGIRPRNKEQAFSLELLMDPNIKLLTLTGRAGCVDPKTQVRTRIIVKDRNIPGHSQKTSEEKKEINVKRHDAVGKASKESLKIFDPISEHLEKSGVLEHDDIFFGADDRKEWFFYDDRIFLYDFCIPKLKLIFEYRGSNSPSQPSLMHEELKERKRLRANASAEDEDVKRNVDRKRRVAEKNGFSVVYLCAEDGFEFNFQKTKNVIFDLLETTGITRDISSIETLKSANNYSVLIETPTGYHEVVNYVNKPPKQTYEVFLKNGLELICTHDHLVMCNGTWRKIEELIGVEDFEDVAIETVFGPSEIRKVISLGERNTVDITVECLDNHYYANGIVSHNCGKTLLALAAGLEQLDSIGSGKAYQKLIVSRPVQPVGRDIGFLPGTLEEKMEPWLAPIRDNLEYLLGSGNKKPRKKKSDEFGGGFKDPYLDLMQQKGLIELEAISFIRGRSIPNAFMIIDEAQNLSMHELKTIVTRAGENTKIVLTGDIEQIDNVHVDTFTNGLTYAVEKFKEYDLSGHVTLLKGERSDLATLASKIL